MSSAVQQFNDESKRRAQELQTALQSATDSGQFLRQQLQRLEAVNQEPNPQQATSPAPAKVPGRGDDDESQFVVKVLKVPLYVVSLVDEDEDSKINSQVSNNNNLVRSAH